MGSLFECQHRQQQLRKSANDSKGTYNRSTYNPQHNDYTAVLQYNVTVILPFCYSVNSFVAVKGAKSDSGVS